MKTVRHLICFLLLGMAWFGTAQAQGFSLGVALGFPALLEARAAYEGESFGVRAYTALYSGVVVGADAYWRWAGDEWGSGVRLGMGVIGMLGSSPVLGVRGLLGGVWGLSPNLALALELRPALPLYSSGGGGTNLVPFMFFLLSLGLSLEVRF